VIVFKPEAISQLETLKLSGYDANERGSKICPVSWNLRNTGCPQIDIIDVP